MTHALHSHLALIQRQIPQWLHQATPAQRAELALLIRDSQRQTQRLKQAFAPLQALDAFCRPLLEEALARWFPDTPAASLLQARVLFNEDPRLKHLSMLEAALQNFHPDAQVKLLAADFSPLALDASTLIKGVRNLDLGQRYRFHLGDVVDNDAFRALLASQDRASLRAETALAKLRGHIDSRGEALATAALANQTTVATANADRSLQCAFLSLFDTPLYGPLVIQLEQPAANEPCLFYLPGDPQGPLRQYDSLATLKTALTQRLADHDFRAFFCRHVPLAEQAGFSKRLRECLYPHYPYAELHPTPPVLEKGDRFSWLKRAFPSPHDIWQETRDLNARLPLTLTPWTGDCFKARARTLVERKFVDAASLAVPVVQLDARAQLARLESWLGTGLTVLNLASFFVPGLAELMLVVGGGQIVDEFLEGVHAANEQDSDEAIAHLFSVVESLAQFAALGAAAGLVAPTGPLQAWHMIDSEVGTRLWHGDLTPFQGESGLPLTAGADGFHEGQGQSWLKMQGRRYLLEKTTDGGRRLAATHGHRIQPNLQGIDPGPWIFAHEQPLHWDRTQLLQRLTNTATGLDQPALQRALQCSGYDEAMLRRVMVDREPAPALLLDSLEALGAQVPPPPAVAANGKLLARDFPSLSARVRAEILAQARPAELEQMQRTGRLPLRLAETARLYLRDARLNRALAQMSLHDGPIADRDALVIGALEQLPGWTDSVRLELREGSSSGRLVHACGHEQLPTKTVIRSKNGYEPRNERGETLANRADIFQAILNALPDSERLSLGLPIHEPQALNDALFDILASDRTKAARHLGMQPVRPLFRLPCRLPSGQLGYPLSGRGQGWISESELFDQLFPSIDAQARVILRQRLLQEAGDTPFGELLERLRGEYLTLESTLQLWIHDPYVADGGAFIPQRSARAEAARRLRMAWRRESTNPLSSIEHVILEIDGRNLGPLPELPTPIPHVRQLSITPLFDASQSNVEAFLGAFPNLRDLDLECNLLERIPNAIARMDQLQSLDLSSNRMDLADGANLDLLAGRRSLQRLNLSNSLQALPVAALDRLASLPSLATLAIDSNELNLTTEHFQALERWPSLIDLSLSGNDITLTAQSRAALARLNRLHTLFLSENPLGMAPDVSGWHQLQALDLQSSGIAEWPTGLAELMNRRPLQLRSLDLSENQLTDAPDLQGSAFAEAVNGEESLASFDFDNNPFTEQAQQRLADAGLPAISVGDAEDPWYIHWPDDLLEHQALTANEPAWQPLYQLFERLVQTADYLSQPPHMRARMQHVLRTLSATPGEADSGGWGRAQLHEQVIETITDATQGCVDQASLLFQQIETDVMLWDAINVADASAASDQVAVDSAAGLLRQQRLDERVGDLYNARVARRSALAEAADDAAREAAPALDAADDLDDGALTDPDYNIDEIEMALHARMQLRETLGLPPQPQQIMFDYLARLSPATVNRLGAAVMTDVNRAVFSQWACEQRFWQAWLRRLRAHEFDALAMQWEAATEYHSELTEASGSSGDFSGPEVPAAYIDALERELGNIDGLHWRRDGVVQRVDLVSDRYADESGIYTRASELLLSTRAQAEQALLRSLTEAMASTLA
ncbi:dermonecrotic toxin domain-containing protein [Pseudomonas plecoglossicida]|uniref:dermonecrotic toxin domain-containing protein n=1 Tax=Pseudomonas plecoglossicida TaxID=70775 RepID=UPI003D1FA5C7